jgi:hypothetical protein
VGETKETIDGGLIEVKPWRKYRRQELSLTSFPLLDEELEKD